MAGLSYELDAEIDDYPAFPQGFTVVLLLALLFQKKALATWLLLAAKLLSKAENNCKIPNLTCLRSHW